MLLSDLSHSPDFRALTLGLLTVVATAAAGSGHVLRSHQRLLDGNSGKGSVVASATESLALKAL